MERLVLLSVEFSLPLALQLSLSLAVPQGFSSKLLLLLLLRGWVVMWLFHLNWWLLGFDWLLLHVFLRWQCSLGVRLIVVGLLSCSDSVVVLFGSLSGYGLGHSLLVLDWLVLLLLLLLQLLVDRLLSWLVHHFLISLFYFYFINYSGELNNILSDDYPIC